MVRFTRRWLLILYVTAAVALFVTAAVFEVRKHILSGVPVNRPAVRLGGRYYYVPRGGVPLEEWPRTEITPEQYQIWQANGRRAAWVGFAAVLCTDVSCT